jgi:hypothetical protein
MSDADNIVVVFRGSDSKEDWFANFQASQDTGPLKGTDAHEGFQDALYSAVIVLTRHVDAAGLSVALRCAAMLLPVARFRSCWRGEFHENLQGRPA